MEMADLRNEFEIKARHKGLNPDSLNAKIDSKVNVFKSRWENSMKDQIGYSRDMSKCASAESDRLAPIIRCLLACYNVRST